MNPQIADETRQLAASIDACIEEISEKHRMHRKIKFLLDVRGLLVINHLQGDYVEFGVYRGEMMYAAARILGPRIGRYIGMDTFHGLPEPTGKDQEIFVFEHQGFMSAPRQSAEGLLAEHPFELIEGDFRRPDIRRRLTEATQKLSIVSIDCNWPSSVDAAVHACAPMFQNGTIVYFDDYFVGLRKPNFNDPIMADAAQRHGFRWVEFMTYPPCGRAFIVERTAEPQP